MSAAPSRGIDSSVSRSDRDVADKVAGQRVVRDVAEVEEDAFDEEEDVDGEGRVVFT
jgi:hypothetical protein